MLDDDHVRLFLDPSLAVFIVEDANDAIAPARDRFKPEVQRHLGVRAAESAKIRRKTCAAHVGREHAFGNDDLKLGSGFGDEFGGGQAWVGAIVVVDDHLAARARGAGEEVPVRHRELTAEVKELDIRRASGGDDDDVGGELEHVVRFSECVVAEDNAKPFAFAHPPVDDAQDLAPATRTDR